MTTSETGLKYTLSVPCLLILTSTFQTLLSLPGKVLTMSPTGRLSISKTTCHFLSAWNVPRYSCLHLLQNVSARLWTSSFPLSFLKGTQRYRIQLTGHLRWSDDPRVQLACGIILLTERRCVVLGNDEGVFFLPHNISCWCAASTRPHQWCSSASWVDSVWWPLLVRHLIYSLFKTCCTHLIMVVLAWSRWLLLHLSLLGFGWLPAGESFKPVRAQLSSSCFVSVSGPTSSKISDCV